MANQFIELTRVDISAYGVVNPRPILIAPPHIVLVKAGKQGTSEIFLVSGDPLIVKEGYAEFKQRLGA